MGNVSSMSATPAGNGKLAIKWTDPAATIVDDGLTLATWEKTVVVVKEGEYATSPDDEDAAYTSYQHYTKRPCKRTVDRDRAYKRHDLLCVFLPGIYGWCGKCKRK